MFTFSEAISLLIECGDQAEVDHYWDLVVRRGRGPAVRVVEGPLRLVVAGGAGTARGAHGRP